MSFFGTNIKKIRQVKGLSQKAFADLFDLNRGVISAYEEGRAEPKIDTLLKVARHFSLDLDDFLTKPLQVNNLVSGSVIDNLMFAPLESLSKTFNNAIDHTKDHETNTAVLQKILATIDLVYEFSDKTNLLSGYKAGDCLFLVQAKLTQEKDETLLVIDQGNLKYLSEISEKKRSGEKVYAIAGYVSLQQKNILSSIMERIEILENKSNK